MYTGTLIERLVATVERVEQRAQESAEPIEFERIPAMVSYQLIAIEPALLGVA
jgi:hypothetical protein